MFPFGSKLAYGCMPLGGGWGNEPLTAALRARAAKAVETALACGINFFDHADIYCRGKSETVFADAFAELRLKRDTIFIQSKCGIRFGGDPYEGAPHRFDFSYEHIVASAENSLKRLRTEYLDVYLLHRPDALVEPAEVARAFDELERKGKVKHFGVSNHNRGQLELLKSCVRQPIVANQVEINLVHTHLLDAGIVCNQQKHAFGADGTLDYCRLNNITLQAWAPLAQGRALGKPGDTDKRMATLGMLVASLAANKGVSKEALAVAWLLRHPAGIQPVIGSTKPERIAAASEALKVTLSREEWYALYVAGRGENLP